MNFNWKYWRLKRGAVKILRKTYQNGMLTTPVLKRYRQSFFRSAELCGIMMNVYEWDWYNEIQRKVKN